VRRAQVAAAAAAMLLAAGGGCAPRTPEAVADKFVDLYFVEIDQTRALAYATGLAHAKLEEELSLVAKIRQTVDPEQSKPSIFYSRKDASVDGDHARATYDLTIRQDRDETRRSALISLERVGDQWKVANFIVREGWAAERPKPQ
jgi:hypothetical protein